MAHLSLHPTPYGRPATQLLRERISAAKADDPLRPVTVVVPTNYVGVSTRRLLASGELGPVTDHGAGVAGLTILTIYRLAELLGAPRLAATQRRPVSTPVVAAAIRRTLADQPGIFHPVQDHPATEEALVRSYRELSELRPATLDAVAAESPRAGEVVRIRREARARLEPDWFEEADLMAAAEAAIRAGSSVLDDLGTVLVHLPQDLSLPAADLLRALAERTPVEVIAGRTGAADADADVDRTLRRLGLQPPASPAVDPSRPDVSPTEVVSVSDAEEEARSAVQRIIAAARDGVPLERLAVLYPSAEPYARLVAEQLDAADVPYNGRAVRPLSDRLLGRWLLDLLALPDRGYARPSVMGLLGGAPVLDANGRWIPAGAWERLTRDAGIVHGRDEWRDKLTRLAADLRHRADVEERDADEPREWLIDRNRREADQADRLRGFVGELFARLDTAHTLTRWSELVEWARTTCERYLGDDRQRARWPEDEQAAADRVEEALDRLTSLDHVEGGTDLTVFRRTLELELDDDLGRVGEFGQGVLVGLASAGLGLDLDVVIVLGLAEGVFPTRPREDSLLPDSERRAAGDELRLRTDHGGVEHRHLLAALAAASDQRVLTFPRGDLRRTLERVPSRWLPREPDHEVASFAHRVRTLAFPATSQEYRLRALAGERPTTRHPLVAADPALRRGVELVRTRGQHGFTRFDGNIGELTAHLSGPADPERVVSTTQLETWLSCPHAYFMRYVLRVEPAENPEELLEIDALEKGSLIHDVLERWLAEQLDGSLPRPGQPWPPVARERMRQLAEAACDDAEQRGVTGHPLLWRRDRRRILDDLDRFLDKDHDRRRQHTATPLSAEQPFGLAGSSTEPVTVDLGDGRQVRLRGRIDRVDRTDAGGHVVTDYKTGGHKGYDDLGPEKPLGDGTKLQLPIYGLAVDAEPDTTVHTEYWFVSTRGEWKRIGYPLDQHAVDTLKSALRVAADGIAAGQFPLRPPPPDGRPFTECVFCDPDDLGTTDRYREWERIRRAEELHDYVSYIAPEALDEHDEGETT